MTAGAKGPVTFQDVTKDLKEATPKDLVLWKKPIASGIVCASGSLLFLMILFMEFTLFSLACFLFQVAMVIFFIAKMVKRPLVPVMDTDYYKDIMRQKADQLSPLLADLAFQFNLVLAWESTATSAKALLLSFGVCKALEYFDLFTCLFLAWMLVWSLPVAYMKNQDKIDPAVNKARGAIEEKIQKVPKLAQMLGVKQKKID